MGRLILPTRSPSIFCALNGRGAPGAPRTLPSFYEWPRAAPTRGAQLPEAMCRSSSEYAHVRDMVQEMYIYVRVWVGCKNILMLGYGL